MTPEQVKHHLRQRGITISQWARSEGYDPKEVSRVLNGQYKAYYGRAHEIAVRLGLKPAPEQHLAA